MWEPACGGGHLSERLKQHGFNVYSTDLVDRGYGDGVVDFLECNEHWHGDIVTNPPYKYAAEFVDHSLELIDYGRSAMFFMKLTFLEGVARKDLFDRKELERVYVFRRRISCAMGGNFELAKRSAVAFAWFVFRKGYDDYPQIRWL